jgi:uncharacterized membrane protein YczE
MNKKVILKKTLVSLIGFATMAFGIAFSIKGALGTSPISSIPYVAGQISGLSVGTTTIILHCCFILLQILLVGIGVSLEVEANFVMVAGEGLVVAICKTFHTKFGTTKVAFDVTLVAFAILLSFLFLGELQGIREGTIAAALFVGQVSRFCIRHYDKLKQWILA